MQVIGLCRFSYPSEGGFQVEHGSIDERRAYLYAPERIDQRFRLFEAVMLPGLRGQTDPDFSLVILVDEALPAPLLDRLHALVQDLPQAVIVARPPGPHRAVCKQVLNSARTDPETPCIQFRMDDDDTVAHDFVARVRRDARSLNALCATNRLVAIDYNRGVLLRVAGGAVLQSEPCVLPYYPMAMAVVVQGGVKQSIMNFAHGKVAQFMPTVTFTDTVMYVRGLNDFNDSRQRRGTKALDPPVADAAGLALLKERFGITPDQVVRVFS